MSLLQSLRGILIGFNGSRTTSLGEIVLPVTVGLVTIFVLFCVTEDPARSTSSSEGLGYMP